VFAPGKMIGEIKACRGRRLDGHLVIALSIFGHHSDDRIRRDHDEGFSRVQSATLQNWPIAQQARGLQRAEWRDDRYRK
jgi:hypothetical protein